MAADGAQDLLASVTIDQFEESALAGFHRRNLRAQIAHGAARQPHVLLDDLDQRFVGLAAIVQFQNRDLQAFGKDVGGDAAQRAADVEPVRHAAGKADQHALVKDRQRQRDVIEVAAGEVGIVGDVDVARPHVLAAEMSDLGLHGLRHAADEHRQPDADGDRLAFGGEQAGGEIERLVDDDVVGGAHEVGLHFLGHRDDAVAHDLGDDRIDPGIAPLSGLRHRSCRFRSRRSPCPRAAAGLALSDHSSGTGNAHESRAASAGCATGGRAVSTLSGGPAGAASWKGYAGQSPRGTARIQWD